MAFNGNMEMSFQIIDFHDKYLKIATNWSNMVKKWCHPYSFYIYFDFLKQIMTSAKAKSFFRFEEIMNIDYSAIRDTV